MPIYAYKCESCGHAKDVLQKMSDDPLSVCPACGQPSFRKQVTAAGFQLKGSGWYVTDFRGGNTTTTAPAVAADGAAPTAESAGKPAAESVPAPAAAPAASPAPSSGSTPST
ncbi:MAG: zinc ribbon domain-containing protein [Hydrogenophaga sp.]|jgi:putative FmdB family regulatory protein|uniref:FmdB family zinc ribbon protein n=1 Tax=Hydrogenophaga sp. TaxID=1904254 RepID=UPI0027274374|nr:FmdB family zinc ribbon protein [Hydrogenophaga sp.]MDO9479592.1 zinc ribbon domain-containing protein [Hydrogenophaga sp.]MDP1894160.1 zinc ribbon domain-containing protein [Hydrogenophaga sp.]MDP2220823.1 zinc ribbon domain-containing protein [Hydrogenophaga sp.]MDP3343361.1 zinc ribbon domain-containing protein [Hydrogenophaga sp.]MDP3808163.1 zinc ribbon domain-containing protein [Hydrogenophaga sp.]